MGSTVKCQTQSQSGWKFSRGGGRTDVLVAVIRISRESLKKRDNKMKKTQLVCVVLLLMAMLQVHCASSTLSLQKNAPADTTAAEAEIIAEDEIRREMRSANRTLYALGLGLGLGTIGFFAGAKIGYEIGYAQDIKNGCEDCGLGGLIYGSLIGAGTGLVGGLVVGQNVGAQKDREAAIQRIKQRRKSKHENRQELKR
jgi:hypothetical protein